MGSEMCIRDRQWTMTMPGLDKIKNLWARPRFKLADDVIEDDQFKIVLKEGMKTWQRIRQYGDMFGAATIGWWERVVKTEIKRLGIERARNLAQEQREHLDLLMLHQRYLSTKLQGGDLSMLGELKLVNERITRHYQDICQKIKLQTRVCEFQEEEKVGIYHHELHKRIVKKSSILRLDIESGIFE